jgi:hypothetical protein
MCAAARSTPWPNRREVPALHPDDLATEPTVRADFSFGQVTIPMAHVIPGRPLEAGSFVKPFPRVPTPTPVPESIPTPLIAPPPSPTRGLAIGFTLGTSLGLAILGVVWHFFL